MRGDPVRLWLSVLLFWACAGAAPEQPSAVDADLIVQARVEGDLASEVFQFTRLHSVAANERFIYVTQEGIGGILVFTSSGKYFKTIGRVGSGPGEFRELMHIGVLHDTLWAFDAGLRRITLFSDTGRMIGTHAVDQLGTKERPRTSTYYSMPASLTSGRVLGFGGAMGRDIASGRVTKLPLLVLTRQGEATDTLGWYSISNADYIVRSQGRTQYMPQPFPDYPLVVYDGSHGKVCVVERAHDGASLQHAEVAVTCIGMHGDTLWRRTLPFTGNPIAAATVDSVRRALSRNLRPRFAQADIDRALHVPRFAAPVSDALGGADGSIWLRQNTDSDSVMYYVLDSDGAGFTTVHTTRSVRVLWASGTSVWGEERDEDDVPTLSRYEVVKRSVR